MQIEAMDEPLRNGLWSMLSLFLPQSQESTRRNRKLYDMMAKLWMLHLREPLDTIPSTKAHCYEFLRKQVLEDSEWYEVYGLMEFLLRECREEVPDSLEPALNGVLKRELAGYRLVGGYVTPVVEKAETEAVSAAMEATRQGKLRGAGVHLEAATAMLSRRETPDYRNSVKESISAVESVCRIICGSDSATLGEALKRMDAQGRIRLHPSLIKGFVNIYGYTSDEQGIRHSLMDEPGVGFADAKYMLVGCSAFVSFLIEKSAEAGIDLA